MLLIAVAGFYGAAYLIHRYIDHSADSPGLSFVLVAVWMAVGVVAGLVSVISLGEALFYRGFTEHFLRDEMAELDARIDGMGHETTDAEDREALRGGDSSVRFGLYFLAFSAAFILSSNALSHNFLGRYSHPGVAVVHMRSADPAVRREGMSMLATRLDFAVTPAVEQVVLRALDDPDEGVAARAAFVVGSLGVQAAAERLGRLAIEQPALTFTALIALGQVGGEQARTAARTVAESPVAQREPRALALMLGMLKVPAVDLLRRILTSNQDEDTQLAALWALGELRNRALLDLLTARLEDPSLAMRCAAIQALEKLAEFDASGPLRAAFEVSTDPLENCPERTVPVQEGGRKKLLVPYRNYQFAIIRALAATDDPTLIRWLVDHQVGVEYATGVLMEKLYDSLRAKDARGELNGFKRRLLLRRLQAGDAGAPPPDGGSAAHDARDGGTR